MRSARTRARARDAPPTPHPCPPRHTRGPTCLRLEAMASTPTARHTPAPDMPSVRARALERGRPRRTYRGRRQTVGDGQPSGTLRQMSWCEIQRRSTRSGLLMPRGIYERTPATLASLAQAAAKRKKDTGRCLVDGCDRPSSGKRANICERHYYRRRRTGTTADPVPPARHPRPTYRAAHSRIARDRGKASSYRCEGCGEPALHWSFAHDRVGDDAWLWDDGRPYTGNPADYDPRCCRCAHTFDRDADYRKQAGAANDQMLLPLGPPTRPGGGA
jgi:hypothetical protein